MQPTPSPQPIIDESTHNDTNETGFVTKQPTQSLEEIEKVPVLRGLFPDWKQFPAQFHATLKFLPREYSNINFDSCKYELYALENPKNHPPVSQLSKLQSCLRDVDTLLDLEIHSHYHEAMNAMSTVGELSDRVSDAAQTCKMSRTSLKIKIKSMINSHLLIVVKHLKRNRIHSILGLTERMRKINSLIHFDIPQALLGGDFPKAIDYCTMGLKYLGVLQSFGSLLLIKNLLKALKGYLFDIDKFLQVDLYSCCLNFSSVKFSYIINGHKKLQTDSESLLSSIKSAFDRAITDSSSSILFVVTDYNRPNQSEPSSNSNSSNQTTKVGENVSNIESIHTEMLSNVETFLKEQFEPIQSESEFLLPDVVGNDVLSQVLGFNAQSEANIEDPSMNSENINVEQPLSKSQQRERERRNTSHLLNTTTFVSQYREWRQNQINFLSWQPLVGGITYKQLARKSALSFSSFPKPAQLLSYQRALYGLLVSFLQIMYNFHQMLAFFKRAEKKKKIKKSNVDSSGSADSSSTSFSQTHSQDSIDHDVFLNLKKYRVELWKSIQRRIVFLLSSPSLHFKPASANAEIPTHYLISLANVSQVNSIFQSLTMFRSFGEYFAGKDSSKTLDLAMNRMLLLYFSHWHRDRLSDIMTMISTDLWRPYPIKSIPGESASSVVAKDIFKEEWQNHIYLMDSEINKSNGSTTTDETPVSDLLCFIDSIQFVPHTCTVLPRSFIVQFFHTPGLTDFTDQLSVLPHPSPNNPFNVYSFQEIQETYCRILRSSNAHLPFSLSGRETQLRRFLSGDEGREGEKTGESSDSPDVNDSDGTRSTSTKTTEDASNSDSSNDFEPILTMSSYHLLRQIPKYISMMYLFPVCAGNIICGITHLFDYYIYSTLLLHSVRPKEFTAKLWLKKPSSWKFALGLKDWCSILDPLVSNHPLKPLSDMTAKNGIKYANQKILDFGHLVGDKYSSFQVQMCLARWHALVGSSVGSGCHPHISFAPRTVQNQLALDVSMASPPPPFNTEIVPTLTEASSLWGIAEKNSAAQTILTIGHFLYNFYPILTSCWEFASKISNFQCDDFSSLTTTTKSSSPFNDTKISNISMIHTKNNKNMFLFRLNRSIPIEKESCVALNNWYTHVVYAIPQVVQLMYRNILSTPGMFGGGLFEGKPHNQFYFEKNKTRQVYPSPKVLDIFESFPAWMCFHGPIPTYSLSSFCPEFVWKDKPLTLSQIQNICRCSSEVSNLLPPLELFDISAPFNSQDIQSLNQPWNKFFAVAQDLPHSSLSLHISNITYNIDSLGNHHTFVTHLIQELNQIFQIFETICTDSKSVSPLFQKLYWYTICARCLLQILKGFSQISACNPNGRALMAIDYKTVLSHFEALLAKKVVVAAASVAPTKTNSQSPTDPTDEIDSSLLPSRTKPSYWLGQSVFHRPIPFSKSIDSYIKAYYFNHNLVDFVNWVNENHLQFSQQIVQSLADLVVAHTQDSTFTRAELEGRIFSIYESSRQNQPKPSLFVFSAQPDLGNTKYCAITCSPLLDVILETKTSTVIKKLKQVGSMHSGHEGSSQNVSINNGVASSSSSNNSNASDSSTTVNQNEEGNFIKNTIATTPRQLLRTSSKIRSLFRKTGKS